MTGTRNRTRILAAFAAVVVSLASLLVPGGQLEAAPPAQNGTGSAQAGDREGLKPVTVRRGGRDVQTTTFEEEPAPDGRPMRAGRLVVQFRRDADEPGREAAHRGAGAALVERLALADTIRVRVPAAAVARALAAYRAHPAVQRAEPDYVVRADLTPDDRRFGEQWGMAKISAPAAWDRTKSVATVKIAVLDCGVYSSSSTYVGPDGQRGHADVRGKVGPERNFTTSPNGADDYCNHGTHVAGIAAASTDNGLGVAGVGFDATILNGKVLDDTGAGALSWVIDGVTWAADNGAKVINMSLSGGGACPSSMQAAVNYAWSRGVVIVAAAGNAGAGQSDWPANCANVLSVAATDESDERASFSNYGTAVDVAAPGTSILSTEYTGDYAEFSGTSMAAPHVAGLAALVWSTSSDIGNAAVVERITGAADRIGGTGSLWAHGRINAAAAVGPAANMVELTVTKAGTGGGTVTSAPAGVNCGTDCAGSFAVGTSVTLTATPSSGSGFGGWGGACSGTAGTCTLTMDAAMTVTATFNPAPPPVTLTVKKSGNGSGTVTSAPAGVNCGSDCSQAYPSGTVVSLTATANSGTAFTGWSGACSGSATVCDVTMDAAKTVTATFKRLADLVVTNVDAPDPVRVGGSITYTIKVTNNGPSTASSVRLEDTLAGLTYSSATTSKGSCSRSSTTPVKVTCTLGNLGSGASATVRITARPTAATTALTNTATATATGSHDPTPTDATASTTTRVDP